MGKCSKYEMLIERYLASEILYEERDDLEKHLAACVACSELYSDLQEIETLLRDVPEKEVSPPPYLKTRIWARIEEEKPPKVRAFSLKPVYALSAAAFFIILIGVYAYFSRPTVVRMVKLTPPGTERTADVYAPQFTDRFGNRVIREVKIFFYNPGARKVSVTGDFNNWAPEGMPLAPTGKKGLWEITIRLNSGVYSYNFIIDGNIIVPDPNAPTQSPDGFGGMNSVLFVGRGEAS